MYCYIINEQAESMLAKEARVQHDYRAKIEFPNRVHPMSLVIQGTPTTTRESFALNVRASPHSLGMAKV